MNHDCYQGHHGHHEHHKHYVHYEKHKLPHNENQHSINLLSHVYDKIRTIRPELHNIQLGDLMKHTFEIKGKMESVYVETQFCVWYKFHVLVFTVSEYNDIGDNLLENIFSSEKRYKHHKVKLDFFI